MPSYNAPYERDIPLAQASIVRGKQSVVPISPSSIANDNAVLNAFSNTPLSENQIQQLLNQGYTRSLAESLNLTKNAFGLRIWVIDNSGSMQAADGHRFIDSPNNAGSANLKMVDCTRWDEIRNVVEHHVQLASLLEAPTRFRLLNPPNSTFGPDRFSISEKNDNVHPEEEVQRAIRLLRNVRPGGCTPLTNHIREIHREVERMEPTLRRAGQRVSITIATDGLPTDERGYGGSKHQQEFVESLRLLEGLSVWVVIRLCTDDDAVVNFYNGLDEILELSIDVLDDFVGEAKEVFAENPWLTYSLPLHRMREMGYHDRLFDLIDERKLTATELRDFSILLFGADTFDGVPDPSADWKSFAKAVERALRTTEMQWNPIKNKSKPLVSIKKLNRLYGRAFRF